VVFFISVWICFGNRFLPWTEHPSRFAMPRPPFQNIDLTSYFVTPPRIGEDGLNFSRRGKVKHSHKVHSNSSHKITVLML